MHHFLGDPLDPLESQVLAMAHQEAQEGFIPVIHTSCALSKPGRTTIDGVVVVRHRYAYPHFWLNQAQKHTLDSNCGDWISHCLWRNLMKEKYLSKIITHVGGRIGQIAQNAAKKRGIPFELRSLCNAQPIPSGFGNWEKLANWVIGLK